jgi:hypothetical protein
MLGTSILPLLPQFVSTERGSMTSEIFVAKYPKQTNIRNLFSNINTLIKSFLILKQNIISNINPVSQELFFAKIVALYPESGRIRTD